MSMRNRAAQFAPFAALTGYDDIIEETARLTDSEISIAQDSVDRINDCVRVISENIFRRPLVTVKYFVPDGKKSGGKYVTAQKSIKKVDSAQGALITDELEIIPIAAIAEIALCQAFSSDGQRKEIDDELYFALQT